MAARAGTRRAKLDASAQAQGWPTWRLWQQVSHGVTGNPKTAEGQNLAEWQRAYHRWSGRQVTVEAALQGRKASGAEYRANRHRLAADFARRFAALALDREGRLRSYKELEEAARRSPNSELARMLVYAHYRTGTENFPVGESPPGRTEILPPGELPLSGLEAA